ncbi:dihydrofolate reductase family protein [Thioalkalivibrio sulfidiphilus]|uniref:Riboflavin biosynthesis protein RibD domain-containing protein n=1 Tax=Thioalkalivibrio sulfidiphilus (strain HL-EbGR7) TaxID=396588 RepID=B8GQM5_THISH|nr:dihydrofolate reductase family protein [Thioalkalivibrio sulfidiphilus]ACL74249.1 riboflavin biosynthesis protein RibD domain-containing protein [Thioalkalivibrio sulfidiphilus HL-EbGr7]
MRASVFIATSLDGFIAREDGGIDWLPAFGKEDYGYQAFFDSVDVLVMGRNTYELARGFGAWPYGDTPVVVLSHRGVEIPPDLAATVECLAAPPGEVLERLAARGLRHAYIDGGKTIQGFLSEGLIDELTLTRVPVLLGRGIPLFGPLAGDVYLEHLETRSYPDGLVQSRYRIA